MITLSLLKFLEDNGFGVIDQDLFWQKMTLDEDGLYIQSVGGTVSRGSRKVQNFEIFSRYTGDVVACQKIEAVQDFLEKSYAVCKLPAYADELGTITNGFNNITIEVTSPATNMGLDDSGRVIYSITGHIIY